MYTTPKSFFDMILLFLKLYEQKKTSLIMDKEQFVIGLKKLEETRVSVSELQVKLEEWKPELEV